MRTRVIQYVDECVGLWNQSNVQMNLIGKQISLREKRRKEQSLERFNQYIQKEKNLLKDPVQRKALVPKVKTGMQVFFQEIFQFNNEETNIITGDGFTNSTRDFMRMAREFDPIVSLQDIFQAGRNLWIVNTLQYLMNEKIEVTPAVFAYSMLYPYTDNYLDDEKISVVQKKEFSNRFRKRLEGEMVIPANSHEKKIFDLVRLVENQYNRSLYPAVFESMLAIHDAQTKSIRLLSDNITMEPDELLSICIEKGGTSVLADGYLVNGSLTIEQERFMFWFGTYLQFVDDIQDVAEDLEGHVCTAFTNAAKNKELEDYTNRTIDFGNKVVTDLKCFYNKNIDAFSNIMLKSINFLMVEAVALNREYYATEYVGKMEAFSPFRYRFVEEKRSLMSVNRITLMGKLEGMIYDNEKAVVNS